MRFKFNVAWFFILLFITSSFSQTRKIDSLKTTLTKSISDSVRAFNLQYISLLYINENVDSAIVYANSLLDFGYKKSNKGYVAKGFKQKADAYIFTNQYDLAEIYLDSTLLMMEETDLSPSAVYTSKGILLRRKGDLPNALKAYLEGIEIDEIDNNNYGKFLKLNNIANIYAEINELERAIEKLKEALSLTNTVKDERVYRNKGLILNNIGTIYVEKKDIKTAITYFKEAAEENLQTENKKELGRNYQNLGTAYEKIDLIPESLVMLNKALKIREEFKDTIELIETNMQLGSSYGKAGNNNKYDSHFYEALNLAKGQGNHRLIAEVYLALSNTLYQNKKYKPARDYLELKMFHSDSLFSEEKVKQIADYEVKYKTEKKEREIAEQQTTIKQQELDIAQKQRQIAIWGGLGGILALLLAASFWTGKERQKRKEQEIVSLKSQQEVVRLEALVSGEEKERVRLAQDLHDGINGDLSVIKFKIDGVDKRKLPKATHEGLDQALVMLDNAIDQVRRISHNLAPPSLQNFNLTEAIKQYASKMQSTHGVQIDFETFGDMPHFSSDQETALYRIVQELLNNIIKHAEAKETLIQLNHTEEHTELVIEDDGKGFDTKISKNGIGLQNIASRVAFLKGNLNIESSGEGSTFTITLPKKS